MLAKLVENWLTNAGELGYQTPFTQVLAIEGHRILQGPVHHPFEQGKDIIAVAPDGGLQAYQLKGPQMALSDFEKIQPQLLALAAAAITHPAVIPPRRADRVFLVTNGTLTPPVRDRLEKFNIAQSHLDVPPIEPIEKDQLVSRFLDAHGSYLPEDPIDVRRLLELYYGDGSGLFPIDAYVRFVEGVLPLPPSTSSRNECRRAAGSATLLTAYAASGWARPQNHLGVAQAWLTLCLQLVRLAALRNLPFEDVRTSYDLALENARVALAHLAAEASQREDLIIPDLVEGVVYGSRSLLVTGFLAAYCLSERQLDRGGDLYTSLHDTLIRESPHVRVAGEADIPLFYLLACALELLGEIQRAERMMLSLTSDLVHSNQPGSSTAFPDPYHSAEEILMWGLDPEHEPIDEEFSGRSYTLHILIDWLARRLYRQHLALIWDRVTRVTICEHHPSSAEGYLSQHDDDGALSMQQLGAPQSWNLLRSHALQLKRTELPELLWQRRELLPYLPLLYRHRFTSSVAKAIDHIGAGHCEVDT